MSVVVAMMDSNFSAAFKRTAAYKQLENSVQVEAAELERLSKVCTRRVLFWALGACFF